MNIEKKFQRDKHEINYKTYGFIISILICINFLILLTYDIGWGKVDSKFGWGGGGWLGNRTYLGSLRGFELKFL